MKTKSLLPAARVAAALLVVTAINLHADAEDKIIKTFQTKPGEQLVVNLDRGTIGIKTADTDSVNVEISRKVTGNSAKAAEILRKNHVVTATQADGKVEVRARYDGEQLSSWFRRAPRLQVSCRVTVPRQFNVDLNTAGGSIRVSELAGKVEARTSGGSMKFGKIEGPISAQTSGGSITVNSSKGTVNVKTSGGALSFSNIEGDLTAQTSGGSIRAENLSGKSVVKTSGGSIEIADINGSIEAQTSGGSIEANLATRPAADCSFKTSGGSVTVALGEKVAVDVDAHTSAGRVSTDFPVASIIRGEQKKNELRGKINGGGPLITAHTSGGSVRLQKN